PQIVSIGAPSWCELLKCRLFSCAISFSSGNNSTPTMWRKGHSDASSSALPFPDPISTNVKLRKSTSRMHDLLKQHGLNRLIRRVQQAEKTSAPANVRAGRIHAVPPVIIRVSESRAPAVGKGIAKKFKGDEK